VPECPKDGSDLEPTYNYTPEGERFIEGYKCPACGSWWSLEEIFDGE